MEHVSKDPTKESKRNKLKAEARRSSQAFVDQAEKRKDISKLST